MDIDVQKCRAFVASAEAGSFALAAKSLGYSISSVSRMIADLELACGFAVLEKGRFGVRLTQQGMDLLPHAKRLIAEGDKFSEAAEQIFNGSVGVVRIGAISSVAVNVLPFAMSSFLSVRPNVSFELLPGDYHEIESWVREGRIDFGTLRDIVPSDFDSRLLFEDELVAVVPKGHELAQRESVSAPDLTDDPFIALELPEAGLSEVAALFESAGQHVMPSFSTWDDNAVMAMVEAGLGLAILPETTTEHSTFKVDTIKLLPEWKRKVFLVWRKQGSLSPAAQGFLSCVLPVRGNRIYQVAEQQRSST